jgi:hypothetical protein
MRLPFRWNRWDAIHLCAALLCAAAITLAAPHEARAWHSGGGWGGRHFHGYHHGGWGGPWYGPVLPLPPLPFFFPPPPFGVRVYPGFHPVPHYYRPWR